MKDEMKARIEAQIAEMETHLAAFVDDANRQIAAQQGGIQALRVLLATLDETAAEKDTEGAEG